MKTQRSMGMGLVVLGVLLGASVQAQISGPPEVIDGDTVEIAGQRIELWGIDAPELGQECMGQSRLFDCGEIARAALLDLTAGYDVVCQPVETQAAADTRIATCTAGGFSINRNMVYTGWALADRATSELYVPVEREAEQAQRGLWRWQFEPPAEWRRRQK